MMMVVKMMVVRMVVLVERWCERWSGGVLVV